MEIDSGIALLLLPPVGYVVAAIWGALWGSFFNVCIYRVPLYESVVWPGSRCPCCRVPIAGYDNIPILSWLLLRGRCRRCKTSISPRYLLAEVVMAALSVGLYYRFVAAEGSPLPLSMSRFIVYFYFTGVLFVLSGIDFDHQLLPDRITYPAIPLFFVLGRLLPDVPLLDASIGVVAGYGLVRLIADGYYHLTGREGMGYGDGKLLALTAGLLGWRSLPLTLLCASLSGLLVTVPLLVLRRRREARDRLTAGQVPEAGPPKAEAEAEPKQEAGPKPEAEPKQEADPPLRHIEVPFGPFLAFGALVYMFLFAGRDYDAVVLQLFDRLVGAR